MVNNVFFRGWGWLAEVIGDDHEARVEASDRFMG
jgi:hypothetical protein